MMAKASMLDAFVQGLRDAGCEFAANYPGTYSQDIFFKLGGDRISANEKVAFERAYGASLAGKRSVVSMKNVGLNTCVDPYLHSLITGVRGGFVVIVTDDTKVVGSQEREDSRHFIDFFGGLWLEPYDVSTAYNAGYESFELSERFDIPVTIRLTSQFFEQFEEVYRRRKPQNPRLKPKPSPEKLIAYPVYWKRQSEGLVKKREAIAAHIEDLYKASVATTNDTAVLIVGASHEEFTRVEGSFKGVDTLKIAHYPLPVKAIEAFISDKKKVVVFEQGDDYVSEMILANSARGHGSFEIVSYTGDSPDLVHQWKTWDHLEKMFIALAQEQPSFVVGDVGQYTVETQHIVDACLCLGSSVGVTLGIAESGIDFPYCVVGDGSFVHSNILALHEAVARTAAFGVIIIDNGGSVATGGQPLIINPRQLIPSGLVVHDIEYKKASVQDFKKILQKMRRSNKLSVLYLRYDKGGE